MNIFKKIVFVLLLITLVVLIVSGFGITQARTVGTLTFGYLDKALAFKLHTWLAVPFTVILLLHLFLVSHRQKI